MSDDKKDDDPAILPEDDLDNVSGGLKLGDLRGGGDLINSFDRVDPRATTVTANDAKDLLSTRFKPSKGSIKF